MRRWYVYQLPISNPNIFKDSSIVDNIKLKDYVPVYTSESDIEEDYELLDELFKKFNINHPEGFAGHSMSISDVVTIEDKKENHTWYYYCDTFGWEFLNDNSKFVKN